MSMIFAILTRIIMQAKPQQQQFGRGTKIPNLIDLQIISLYNLIA